MGKWFWAILFPGLCLGAAAKADNCTLKQLASLDMADTSTAVVVDAIILGRPFHFLIDTGGVYSVIYRDVAEILKLDLHPIRNGIETYDVYGNLATQFASVADLKLGTVYFDRVPMTVEQRPPGPEGIDGILSPDILARLDLDFDFAARKLRLMSPDHCTGEVVYWTKEPYATMDFKLDATHIVVPITLDGHDLQGVLDTGSSLTRMDDVTSLDVFGLSATSPGAERNNTRTPASVDRFRYGFNLLSMGGVSVKNPLVYVVHSLAPEGFRRQHSASVAMRMYGGRVQSTEFIVGMNVLSKLHLYVSYKEKKLYITGADAH